MALTMTTLVGCGGSSETTAIEASESQMAEIQADQEAQAAIQAAEMAAGREAAGN